MCQSDYLVGNRPLSATYISGPAVMFRFDDRRTSFFQATLLMHVGQTV